MQPQIPPTPIHGPSAPAPNPRNIALDWVDALGILGTVYGLGFVLYLFELEIPRAVILATLLGFPLARRRWMGKPVQTVTRDVSALGVLSTLLIAFGTLGGGALAYAIVINAKPVERPPLTGPILTMQESLPANASAEERASFELQRQEMERMEAVYQERLYREERIRDEENRRERMLRLLLFCVVPVGMVALGGFLDRRRMRRDAAASPGPLPAGRAGS